MQSFKEYFYEFITEQLSTSNITVHYMSADGFSDEQTYSGPDAKEKAIEYIDHWVGKDGEISHELNYITSSDGMGRVAVKGVNVWTLLGKNGPDKKESYGNYSENIGHTLMMLHAPTILNVAKERDGSYVFDFTLPSKDKIWGRQHQNNWRFIYVNSFNQYEGDITSQLVIFYTFMNERHSVYNKHITYEPTGDRDEDMKKSESVWKDAKKIVKFISDHIRNNAIKLK